MRLTKNFTSVFLFALFTGFILSGCSDSNAWKKVDVSKEKVSFRLERFDRDIFLMDTAHLMEGEERMRVKYGPFYDFYIRGVMNFGRSETPVDTTRHDPHIDIRRFLTNPSDRGLYDTVQKEYANTSDIEAQLTDVLKHFQHYFPRKPHITRVYTFITEFGNGVATYDDSTLCIGLDMYLGSNYRYYQSLDFPLFMVAKLQKKYIVPNLSEVIYNYYFDNTAYNAQLPLIEALINEGKKYYFMECMMPDAPDSLIMGYTPKQEQWCRLSEKSIWQYFNERDLLYKVNYMEQKRYITDGPSTAGMPAESPGKVGAWVGWQIVRKFMKNNRNKVTLPDLLEKYSAKQIFSQSNYKPK